MLAGGVKKPPLPTFSSRLHDERTASLVGSALGVAFTTAFLTGLISHYLQHPPSWLAGHLWTRPTWGYRLTQGLHVTTGIATIPLLLAKLWTVFPKLFEWPPVKSALHALERLSILVLFAGAMFELVTGLLNAAQWYPWKFPFIQTHFWVAWVTVGALVVHIGVKAPEIQRGLRLGAAGRAAKAAELAEPAEPAGVSRRTFILTTAVATGTVVVATVGQSVNTLRPVSVLSPRDVSVGPQALPINRTATQAGVTRTAVDPGWKLDVVGPKPVSFTLAELAALPQSMARLPIACVEGWSKDADWTGVRISDLLELCGAPKDAGLRVTSLEKNGPYGVTVIEAEYARDPLALLAIKVNGEPLALDHGYPARIIVPNRPGVLQTKWVERLEVLA